MSITILTLAKLAVIKAVKRHMQAQEIKTAHVERRVNVAAADVYLTRHPELIGEAAETVRKVPQFRTLYEREMRRRRRNQR